MEKSSTEEADINAQRVHAVRSLAESLAVVPSKQLDHVEPNPPKQPRGAKLQKGQSSSVARGTASQMSTHSFISDVWTHALLLCKPFLADRERGAVRTVARVFCHESDAAETLRHSLRSVHEMHGSRLHRFVLGTGNAMIDQFQPWYFGVAFAFSFKYCTGMPDMPVFAQRPRHRRPEDAPRIEAPLWVRTIARRVEQQVKRDWLLGFSPNNYLFRSALNLIRTVYSYETFQGEDGQKGFTGKNSRRAPLASVTRLWASIAIRRVCCARSMGT